MKDQRNRPVFNKFIKCTKFNKFNTFFANIIEADRAFNFQIAGSDIIDINSARMEKEKQREERFSPNLVKTLR